MRIVCPICSATYEVRETLLVPGRTARCAQCGEEWTPVPATPLRPLEAELLPPVAAAATPPSAPASPLTAMERLARHRHPPARSSRALSAAWAASFLVLLLFAWGLFAWRADLMQAWPPSTRLFNALGITATQPATQSAPSPTH